MSGAAWKPDKDLCRCCLGEGSYHNLAEPRFELGQSEVYVDMLKSCLDIEITPVDGVLCSTTYTICESCILRLRDASNFKKQVVLCEARFKVMYEDYQKSYKNILQALRPQVPQPEVKEEAPATFDTDVKVEYEQIDDDEEGVDLKFDDSDDDEPVIKIKVEHTKKKGKTKTKTRTKSKRKKLVKNQELNDESAEMDDAVGDEDIGDEGNSYEEDGRKAPKSRRARHPKFRLKDSDFRSEDDNFVCTYCDKKYDKYFSLRYHIKAKHYKIAKYSCPICKKEFMTPAPFTVHKLQEHNIDERFKCKACNAVFNTTVQLRKHINNFHMLGEKYKCESCDYESFSFEGMYKHKFKHKTVKDYHCRFCRKSFLRKATLDLHERIHTGDRRKVCTVCGQAFVQKASLNYHMTKYHPEVNF